MLRIEYNSIILVLITFFLPFLSCDNENINNFEDKAELKKRYDLLVKLSVNGSDVSLRGVGKCYGRLFLFLNQPYIYEDPQGEMMYSDQLKRFQMVRLKTEFLTS